MNIYVSNLDFNVDSNELQSLFADFGEVVSANVITDRMSGRSRGFGFVEMKEKGEALAALRDLNGKSVMGRNIVVAEAREREERGDRDARSSRNSYSRSNNRW